MPSAMNIKWNENEMKGLSDRGLPDTPLVDLLLTQALVFSQMSKPDCLKTLNAKQILFEINQDGHLNVWWVWYLIPLGRLLESVVVGDKDLLTGDQVSSRHDRHHQAVPGYVEEFGRLRQRWWELTLDARTGQSESWVWKSGSTCEPGWHDSWTRTPPSSRCPGRSPWCSCATHRHQYQSTVWQ